MLLGARERHMPDLDCTLSVSLRGARVEVCRWITNLASGSSRWGPNEVVVRGPRHTPPALPQIALKLCATVSACLRMELSVPALPVRPQRKMMSVMRAYEGDVLDEG